MRYLLLATLIFLTRVSAAQADPAEDCNQVRDFDRQLRGCTAYLHARSGCPESRYALPRLYGISGLVGSSWRAAL